MRIPGVIKLRNGEYTSLNLHIDIEETLAMRASIIRHTADIFDPDMFIVDKEPLGLRGEVRPTLDLLQARGTPLVLGLRDVMDDPSALETEWERKNVAAGARRFYDEIWVYGLPQICDPLDGIDLPPACAGRWSIPAICDAALPVRHAGAARRPAGRAPFLLVTPGGGGDGEDLIDWVLAPMSTTRPAATAPCSCSARSCSRTARPSSLARAARCRM